MKSNLTIDFTSITHVDLYAFMEYCDNMTGDVIFKNSNFATYVVGQYPEDTKYAFMTEDWDPSELPPTVDQGLTIFVDNQQEKEALTQDLLGSPWGGGYGELVQRDSPWRSSFYRNVAIYVND